jgi:ornithine cyclodeaminase
MAAETLAVLPFYDETAVARALSPATALQAVRRCLVAAAQGEATLFPVVRETLPSLRAVFGIKSACDAGANLLGLKAGGYWSGNEAFGLTNHQSIVLLFDPATGRARALLEGNRLTALRTAAAAAASIDALARRDAKVLGIVGTGRQAPWHIDAALAVRRFERIVVWNRHEERAQALAAARVGHRPALEVLPLEAVCRESDVLITLQSSFEPVVRREWIRPGAHIAAMGTDTRGKQELDPALVAAARVATDDVAQALSIGECQHAHAAGLLHQTQLTHLGDVITGRVPGRRSGEDITLYDGTGTALQDLACAALVLGGEKALAC